MWRISAQSWIRLRVGDGAFTAGAQSRTLVERKEQLPTDSDGGGAQNGKRIIPGLTPIRGFSRGTSPSRAGFFRPCSISYVEEAGANIRVHVDNALRWRPTHGRRIRTTFGGAVLAEAREYDGGELVARTPTARTPSKLSQGTSCFIRRRA